jgi:hypothetical protein
MTSSPTCSAASTRARSGSAPRPFDLAAALEAASGDPRTKPGDSSTTAGPTWSSPTRPTTSARRQWRLRPRPGPAAAAGDEAGLAGLARLVARPAGGSLAGVAMYQGRRPDAVRVGTYANPGRPALDPPAGSARMRPVWGVWCDDWRQRFSSSLRC